MSENHRSAFVAVVGRPSVGKSTLMNTICGEKVAIVSPVPQTTRNTIRGIKTGDDYQLVFLDTPGIHNSDKVMNKKLKEVAEHAFENADLILYVLDSTRAPGQEEASIVEKLQAYLDKTICALNKIDHYDADVAATRSYVNEVLPSVQKFELSAQTGEGVEALVDALVKASPLGPEYYPPEYYTDQEPVFRIAEIIREKVFLNTKDEVPHAVFVEYKSHHNLPDGTLVYEGDLVIERESQKGIIIGKSGAMIRKIREEAEHDLCEIFPYPVKLSLQVRVQADWKKDDKLLKNLIN